MMKRAKLLIKAKNNPDGVSFEDFQTLLRQCEWVFEHQTGSHQIWYSPHGYRLSVQQARNGKAKSYQVKQFLIEVESEKGGK